MCDFRYKKNFGGWYEGTKPECLPAKPCLSWTPSLSEVMKRKADELKFQEIMKKDQHAQNPQRPHRDASDVIEARKYKTASAVVKDRLAVDGGLQVLRRSGPGLLVSPAVFGTEADLVKPPRELH
jgi:hypothetical protein